MTSSCPYHFVSHNQLVMDDFVSCRKCATLICEGLGPIYTLVTMIFGPGVKWNPNPEEINGISWGHRGLGSFQAVYYCTCSKVTCGLAVDVKDGDQIWFWYLSQHIVWAIAQFWGFKSFTCISIQIGCSTLWAYMHQSDTCYCRHKIESHCTLFFFVFSTSVHIFWVFQYS